MHVHVSLHQIIYGAEGSLLIQHHSCGSTEDDSAPVEQEQPPQEGEEGEGEGDGGQEAGQPDQQEEQGTEETILFSY